MARSGARGNVLARLGVTTVYMAIITLIAALIPFFGCEPTIHPYAELQKVPWCLL